MSHRKKVLTASLWVIGAFGLGQVLRLGGNLVVTRLLEPEMFGIMAIVFVVMHGLAMFSDVGLWSFIVRHKSGTQTHILDTVWTMQVIRGWVIFTLIVLFVLLFQQFKPAFGIDPTSVYGYDQLPILLIVVGFSAVINCYKTMAPAVQSKELNRAKLESITLASQFLGITVMLLWAWLVPTIWALVVAGLISSITSIVLIYKVFPIRNHFSWDKNVAKEVFHFGKWIFLASILTFLAQQGDKLFFGAHISAAQLGVYSIAFMLASTLTAVTQQLVSKVLFPVFSRAVNSEEGVLKEIYYDARLKLDAAVYLSAGGLLAVAPTLIGFLYDERYIEAGWMLQILTVSIIGMAISDISQECLSAIGQTKIRMQVMVVRSIGLLISLPLFFNLYGFHGAVWAVALNVWLGIPVIYWVLNQKNLFSWLFEIRMMPLAVLGYGLGSLF